MYMWYRPGSGVKGLLGEMCPCHDCEVPARCSATVNLIGRVEDMSSYAIRKSIAIKDTLGLQCRDTVYRGCFPENRAMVPQ